MEANLWNPDPTACLPHRPPFLFVDRLLDLEPGVSARGEFAVTAGGYFPPVLLVEAMAQVGGIAAGGGRAGEGGLLAALDKVSLPDRVRLNARFTIYSKVVKTFGRLIQVEGEVREDGVVVASATLTLVAGDR